MAKTQAPESKIDVEATMARLRAFVETFTAMASENERRATLYYLIASEYGNEVGDAVLRVLPR